MGDLPPRELHHFGLMDTMIILDGIVCGAEEHYSNQADIPISTNGRQ